MQNFLLTALGPFMITKMQKWVIPKYHSIAKRLFTYILLSKATKPACLIRVKECVANGHAKLNHVQKIMTNIINGLHGKNDTLQKVEHGRFNIIIHVQYNTFSRIVLLSTAALIIVPNYKVCSFRQGN